MTIYRGCDSETGAGAPIASRLDSIGRPHACTQRPTQPPHLDHQLPASRLIPSDVGVLIECRGLPCHAEPLRVLVLQGADTLGDGELSPTGLVPPRWLNLSPGREMGRPITLIRSATNNPSSRTITASQLWTAQHATSSVLRSRCQYPASQQTESKAA